MLAANVADAAEWGEWFQLKSSTQGRHPIKAAASSFTLRSRHRYDSWIGDARFDYE
jgi:hypothetical protein